MLLLPGVLHADDREADVSAANNPHVVTPATSPAQQAQAEEEKAAGNRAFGAKEYDKAIGHFTVCIRLDPE